MAWSERCLTPCQAFDDTTGLDPELALSSKYSPAAASESFTNEASESGRVCRAILQQLEGLCKNEEHVPLVQQALLLAQTHIFFPNLEQPQFPQQQYHTGSQDHMTKASVHVPPAPKTNARLVRNKKKLATPGGTGVTKTLSSKRGRGPTEQMRKAFRQIVAGSHGALSLLRRKGMPIGDMNQCTLKDILGKALKGVEPPINLNEVSASHIIDVALVRLFPNHKWANDQSASDVIYKIGGGPYRQGDWLKNSKLWPPCGEAALVKHVDEMKKLEKTFRRHRIISRMA